METVNANEIAPLLASYIDEETKKRLQGRSEIDFKVVGDTVFTRAIQKKLDKLGIKRFDCGNAPCPYVIDLESEKSIFKYGWVFPYNGLDDIDCCNSGNQSYETSCVAEACFRIITRIPDYQYAHIGIVGRGHAVLGLAKRLITSNYTVTQCHSKTKNLNSALAACDVIVYAAPVWNEFDIKNRVVLDVSYCILKEYESPNLINNIGTVNTSIVVLRAVTQYMNLKNKKTSLG